MLYALIMICLAAEPVCDLDHAIWAEQSPPLYDSQAECEAASIHYLTTVSPPQLVEGAEYQIEVQCEAAILSEPDEPAEETVP